MDRIFPHRWHRRPVTLLLAILLVAGPWPGERAHARLPVLSDEPAGDPGDGVLRPADYSSAPSPSTAQSAGTTTAMTTTTSTTTTVEADAATATTGTWLLLPCFNPAGQPWLTFRLIRCEPFTGPVGHGGARTSSFAGRWHRAP